MIKFAEWLAKNHYKMINETNGICLWKSESDSKPQTTKYLLKKYKHENN